MKSKIQLVLTNPCTRQWDDLLPSEGGRHCDSCNKNIVDLSLRSDAELIDFFKNKNDNLCGRLRSSQLNRELVSQPRKLNWQWLLPIAVGAMIATPTHAQNLKLVSVPTNHPSPSLSSEVKLANKLPSAKDTISGNVVDNITGKPLKGVKLKEKGFNNILAQTDSIGRFELEIKGGSLSTIYTFELSEYSSMDWRVTDGMLVKLRNTQTMHLGGVSVVSLSFGPLIMISAGKKSCSIDMVKFSELPQEWIEKIEILKDANATALYGSKAVNGVVLVEIKKAFAKKIDFSKKD
jgi:TonB-dependent SusC/RagA subfamily outer membrane receptor